MLQPTEAHTHTHTHTMAEATAGAGAGAGAEGGDAVEATVDPSQNRVKIPNFMEATTTAQGAVRAVLEDVVQAGGDTLYDHYLSGRELDYALERSIEDIAHVMSWAALARSEPSGEPTCSPHNPITQ